MVFLPEQLIVAILLRLPVKSLLRFKSVCKVWRSLISNPRFGQSHFEMSSSIADKIVHLADSGPRSIDFHSSLDDDSAIVNLNFPITPPPLGANIRGSCRGFVLLDHYCHFFVWNPSTGLHKRVPYFPMSSQFAPFIHGLGYDAADDDYLVALGAYDPHNSDFNSDFQFFSVKANSWKKIEGTHNFPYMNAMDEPRAGLFLNGAIHWLAFRHDTNVELILAFNVTQRKLIDISLPDDFFQSLEFTYLGTLGGYLSLSVLDDEVEIWLMKEYGMKSSWTKSMVVSVEIPRGHYFFPLCLTKTSKIMGSDRSDVGRLVKCNDKGKVLEYREYDYKVDEPNAIIYTESLLSLPCELRQWRRRRSRRATRMNEAWGLHCSCYNASTGYDEKAMWCIDQTDNGNPFHCCFRGTPAFWAFVSYSKLLDKDDVVASLLWMNMRRLSDGEIVFQSHCDLSQAIFNYNHDAIVDFCLRLNLLAKAELNEDDDSNET
ncbi:hypothetical protein K1719_000359 [Acacia pycnantha]|nr:hypothetical protein K1719_000359 [Acacia pycnantha]